MSGNGNGIKPAPAHQRLAAQDGNWRRPPSPALAIPSGSTIIKDPHRSTIATAPSNGSFNSSHHLYLLGSSLGEQRSNPLGSSQTGKTHGSSLGEQRSHALSSSQARNSPVLAAPSSATESLPLSRHHRPHLSSADERQHHSVGGRNNDIRSHSHHRQKDASTADSWRSHHARISEPSHSPTAVSFGSPHHQRRHVGFVAASNASEVARRAFIASEIGSIGSPSSKSSLTTRGEGPMCPSNTVVVKSPLVNSFTDRQGEATKVGGAVAPSGSLGPAFNLRPLRVSGFDTTKEDEEPKEERQDWAETPTSSLPSLPSSPSWIPPAPASTSRQPAQLAGDPVTRNDESALSSSFSTTNTKSPLARAIINGSPARHNLSMGAASVSLEGSAWNILGRGSPLPVHKSAGAGSTKSRHLVEPPVLDAEDQLRTDGQPSETVGHDSVRREPAHSLASLVGHGLQHSRRDSASNYSSPSTTSVVSARQAYGGVYRPPHLRNQGSSNGLKPVIAHYDRIRTPSLRGSLRSPEPPHNRSKSHLHMEDSASSASTSLAGFLESSIVSSRVASPRPGLDGQRHSAANERSGLLESYRSRPAPAYSNVLVEHDEESEDDREHESDDDEDRVSRRPSVLYHLNEDNESLPALDDDFDLTHEDMLQHKTSLTDSYCRSRARRSSASSTASSGYQIGNGVPVVDILEVGDRLGPGMIHDGHLITIAKTTEGFQSQQRDVTGTRLEVKSKLGEGSYAVVYLVEEIAADDGQIHVGPRDEEGLMASKRGGRAIAGHQNSDNRNDDETTEGDATLADTTIPGTFVQNRQTGEVNYNNDELSSTLRATRLPRNSLAKRAADEEEAEQRRVLAQEDVDNDDFPLSQTLPGINEPHEGRLFALKCLCKRDLSEEMLELQRLEATIHQSIPPHKNIITLYRTYETPEWLFLVLEYCPGQDLYYWLEQAHDVDGDSVEVAQKIVRAHQSRTTADDGDRGGNGTISPDGTPPSPSLLASTSDEGLLSRKRLKLISKMFRQVCEAVQFCHDHGIAHRDLKPENLIVYDRRGEFDQQQAEEEDTDSLIHDRGSSDGQHAQPRRPMSRRMSSASSIAMSTRSVSHSSFSSATTAAASNLHKAAFMSTSSAVIVKLTDFGLATADAECRDFSCGSRPYMSPECHLNLSDKYDPYQADVWSLGIVLLNMIFHRSPFKEPNSERCPSFASYCYEPVEFLMRGFEGLTRASAEYLSSKVLCNVVPSPFTEDPEQGARQQVSQLASQVGNRVTPREFARWAKDLPSRFGLGIDQDRKHLLNRGFSADHTSPLIHSRAASVASRISAEPPHSAATVVNGMRGGAGAVGLDSPGSRGSVSGQRSRGTSEEYHPATSQRQSPLSSALGLQISTLSPPSLVKSRLASPLSGGRGVALTTGGSSATMARVTSSAPSISPVSPSVDGHLWAFRGTVGADGNGSMSALGVAMSASPSPIELWSASPSLLSSPSSTLAAGKRLHSIAIGGGASNSDAPSPNGSIRSGDGSVVSANGSGRSSGGTSKFGAGGGGRGASGTGGRNMSRSSSSFVASEVVARMLEKEVKV